MAREYPRSRRVEQQLQRVLAELLVREVKDPRVQGVNVTAVEVSSDLSVAKVYFSLLEPEDDAAAALGGLHKASGFLRTQVGRSLRLRHVPELRFRHDESAAHASDINRLIEEARRRDADRRR